MVFRVRGVARCYQSDSSEFRLLVPALDITRGSRLAFVGESGAGKSTLLEILALVLQPSRSESFVFRPAPDQIEHDVQKAWRGGHVDQLTDLRRDYIGYVMQTGGLLPYLTVRENINLSRQLQHAPLENRAAELAEKLRIGDQLEKLPSGLSVGQRQRVAIARALAHEPPVLITDEPTASLDPVTAEAIATMLVSLVEEMNVTLIMATHARDLVERLGFHCIEHEITARGESTMTVTVSTG